MAARLVGGSLTPANISIGVTRACAGCWVCLHLPRLLLSTWAGSAQAFGPHTSCVGEDFLHMHV